MWNIFQANHSPNPKQKILDYWVELNNKLSDQPKLNNWEIKVGVFFW